MEAFHSRADHVILRYGPWVAFPWVTRITESFANQTIVEPSNWDDYKWLEFSGGNVAVTIHGFLRGSNRRRDKAWLEALRNFQAFIANIPAAFNVGTGGVKIGLGQIALWLLGFSFYIQSEMTFQFNMLIKTMEFEHSPQYGEEYAFNIVFEKLSFGIVQFAVDLITSGVTGFFLATNTKNKIGTDIGQSADQLLATTATNNSGADNPLGDWVSNEELPSPISTEIDIEGNSVESLGEEPGQIVRIVTDETFDNKNIPQRNTVIAQLDSTLEWRELPFLSTFPQSFTFALGSYNYGITLRVYDYQDDDEVIHYDLWMNLTRDGEDVYLGKVQSNMQYNLGTIAIYISNFKMETTRDAYTMSFIEGMVSDLG